MKNQMVKGYTFAILSAVIHGCMPLMAKYVYADGVNPATLVFLRNFFSLIPLGVLAYRQNKTLKVQPSTLPHISIISLLGCSITPILLFTSYKFIPSGTATVFHFTYPAMVVIAGLLFLKNRAKVTNIIAVFLCVVGVCMFYTPGAPLNFTGSALALLSGVTFAANVVMLSRFDKKKASGFLFTFYVVVVSSIAMLVYCLVTNSLVLPSSLTGWGLCLLFSLLVTTGAVVLFQESAFLIGGERVSILSTLEPITSVVVGVVVFNEKVGLRVLLGVLLVLSASLLTALYDMKKVK
jgi:drug/metabolite transporter (DMT)-like permease